MDSDVPRRVRAARRWLDTTTGCHSSDLAAVAVERVRACLTARLGGVIGDGGVDAVFARSVVSAMADGSSSPPPLGSCLSTHLSGLTPPQAWKSAEAILVTFIEVLISLIGEPLAWRLLSDIHPPESDREPKDSEDLT